MEKNKSIIPIYKSEPTKTKIIIENVVKMLSKRIYIDSNKKKNQLLDFDKSMENIENRGDHTYIIEALNGDKYALKIIFQKISATGKQSILHDFLTDYVQYKRIIVAKEFNNKISEFVTRNKSQIFSENIMLEDMIENIYQPKFELLDPEEMDLMRKEYNTSDYTTSKILQTDPVTKYFDLKKGDIIRIIRPSPTSGESVSYRVVF